MKHQTPGPLFVGKTWVCTAMLLLQPPDEEKEGEAGEKMAEEETVIYKYIPPESKDWVSRGSEKEITEESVIQMRRRVCGDFFPNYFWINLIQKNKVSDFKSFSNRYRIR